MEDFIPFELSKRLKQKRFPQYIGDDGYTIKETDMYNIGDRQRVWLIPDDLPYIAAPTIAQVLKWLREKSIFILPMLGCVSHNKQHFQVKVIVKNDYPLQRILDNDGEDYTTYEESALAGIEYILNNNII